MDTRRAALLFGIVFLVVGILGFVPGVNQMHHGDPASENLSVGGPGHGNLLGLFHVNVLHNAVHLLFGVMGLVMSRTLPAARGYFRIVAVAYLLLTVMGLIAAANMWNTYGLVPIHGNDVWLHALLGLVGAYFGFIKPAALEGADATYPTTTTGTTGPTGTTRP
jgi:hypothetical protein